MEGMQVPCWVWTINCSCCRNKAGPGGVCDWAEPSLEQWQGQPDCLTGPGSGPTLSGQFYRISSCEIMYGPFNCDFSWRPDNSCAAPPMRLLMCCVCCMCSDLVPRRSQ